jgi:hypothetical protein
LPTLLYSDADKPWESVTLVGVLLELASGELNVYKRVGSFRMFLKPLPRSDREMELEWVFLTSAVLGQPWSESQLEAKVQEGKFLKLDGSSGNMQCVCQVPIILPSKV